MDLVLKWCMGRKGERAQAFLWSREWSSLNYLDCSLFSTSFSPSFFLFYSKFRKVEFLKKNRAEEKSLFPMDLRHIPSIFKTLKAYLGLHFHTIFDFVCHGISSPECLMPKDFEFEKCMESKGRHLSTFCPPVSHIDAYQFTLIELIGALCVQGVGK